MSKLKELQRRSTIAWSVSSGRPDLLAAGTMAGTVGFDFDTSAQLEIFSLDLDNSSSSLSLVGKTTSANMFHKIVWGQSTNGKYGILAGGMDNGTITIWDPAKISTEGSQEGLLGNAQKHKGPVQALDFNPFQQNLLASGATDSEIFIWDLGKPADPTVYTPGAKPQQASDIASVAWNKKVQHILASTQFSGVTVIWDLKAKKPVINFADRNSKARAKSLAWHPLEATQILTASEEDDAPVLQMWDLRNVFTPVRTFNGHTKGVWGVSWSPFDPSLVLSCGKDNRTLCWHVETAEVLCEVESGADPSIWNIDVQWSPRIPAVLSTSSLEGKVSIYALQDVCERTVVTSDLGGAIVHTTPNRAAPKHTPGWLQRPCGVAFGFGGKLLSFEKGKDPKAPRTINVSNVVTEKDVLKRSERLEEVINGGNFTTFCDEKIEAASSEEEKSTWSFLRVLFDSDARHKILNYLGFDEAKTQEEIKDFISSLPTDKLAEAAEAVKEEEPKTPSPPPTKRSPTPPVESPEETAPVEENVEGKENADVSGLFGPGGEEFSFEQQQQQDSERIDAHEHDHSSHSHSHEHVAEEPVKPVKPVKKGYSGPPIEIPTGEAGPESAITKALLIGNFEAAVQCCLRLDRVADALILAANGGPELWARTQEAYFARQTHSYARVMSAVVRNDLRELVDHSVLRDWKATLATLCTYTKSADFPSLCSALGDRLDQSGDTKAAILCYICAGSIDKAVSIWVRSSNSQKSPHLVLQDLVEKIAIFRQAVGVRDDLNDLLASKYSEYAEILASQGRATAALRYLSFLNDPKYSNTSGAVLLDRVYHSSSESKGIQEPVFPFKRVQVYSQGQQPIHPQAPVQQVAPSHTPFGVSTPAPSYSSPTPAPTPFQPPTTFSTPHVPSHHTHQTVSNSGLPAPTHGSHSSYTNAPPSYTSPAPPPPITTFTPSVPAPTPNYPPTGGQSAFSPIPTPQTVFTPGPSNIASPPPVSAPLSAPPPVSTPSTPPTGVPPTGPSRPAANAPATPSGDASFVNNALAQHIEAANAASARNPALKAKTDDMTKRVKQLQERLRTGSVNATSVDSLTKLVTALNDRDTAGAQAVLVQLSTGTNDVGAGAIIGLKHLIALSKP